jgi:hypothetical protein
MFSAALPISDIRRERASAHFEAVPLHLDDAACVRVSAIGLVDPAVSRCGLPNLAPLAVQDFKLFKIARIGGRFRPSLRKNSDFIGVSIQVDVDGGDGEAAGGMRSRR